MQLTLGEMLYRFRIERDVKARAICFGICSTSSMSNMESGERVPDTLLFEFFMERMGVSPENFSIMITEEENVYHVWRNQVLDAIENEQWDELGQLLQSKILKKTYCNKKLELQFFSYASAIYNAKQGDYVKAAELLKKAAEQTMPEPSGIIEANVLLGTLELSILMLYLYYGVKGEVLSQKQGRHLFELLENYISSGALDINEQAKCYPKLVCIGVHVLEQLEENKLIRLLEQAINFSQEDKSFHDLTEVLRFYLPFLEKRSSNELRFYKKQYEVFCDLLQSEDLKTSFIPEITIMSRPKYYIINEYLSSKRNSYGLTQEELCEGICEPETYSRVENGKHAPSRKNFKLLSERLDIGWNYYRGELDTCDPKAFKLRSMQRIANIEGRWQESLDLLKKLEKCLDMNCIENYQYVKGNEFVIKSRLGTIDIATAYKGLEQLLYLTQKMDTDTSRLVYYSQTELEIIGYMAQLLRQQDKCAEGIAFVIPVLKQMQNSKLDFEKQWNGFGFIFRVLANLYFGNGDYTLSILIAKYVKKYMIKNRNGSNLATVLDSIADSLEHQSEQHSEEYKKLYRYTYYLADFYNIEKVKIVAQKYYENSFEPEMDWYNV